MVAALLIIFGGIFMMVMPFTCRPDAPEPKQKPASTSYSPNNYSSSNVSNNQAGESFWDRCERAREENERMRRARYEESNERHRRFFGRNAPWYNPAKDFSD